MVDDDMTAGHSQHPRDVSSGGVVCFGFLTHCLLLRVDDLPPQNGGAPVLDSVETIGDDAVIVASILTSWGVPTRLITSPAGDDHRGMMVREHLESWGVDDRPDVRQGWQTPFEVAILDSVGGRTYFQRRDTACLAELKPPSPSELAGAALLYVDWYDGPSVITAMENAVTQGVPVFLNLESQYDRAPWASGLLRYANFCQVSLDEPGGSGGDPYDIARALISQGVETAIVTLGAGGSVVARGRQGYHVGAPPVEVVDCFGAGAAFSAGVIYGLRQRWPLESVVRFACAYAGLKCGLPGMARLPVSEVQKTARTLDVRLLSE